MTDDLTVLDARGLAAGRMLRAAAAVHPVPVFEPDLLPLRVPVDGPVRRGGGRTGGSDGSADPADPPGRRRWIALVGVAAAVALLVGVVVRSGGGDDDSAPVDDVEVDLPGVAAYVADPPPEGLDLVSLTEPWSDEERLPLPGDGGGEPMGPAVVLYGPEPAGRPGLAVVWVDAWAGGGTVPDPGGDGPRPTEAAGLVPIDGGVGGGRRAWATPPTGQGSPAVLVEVDGGFARVHRAGDATQGDGTGSQSAATVDDVLVAAAGAVVAEPEARRATIDPSGLPTGWAEQGEVDTRSFASGSVVGRAGGGPRDEDGYLAVYGEALRELDVEAPGPDVRGVVISVAPGDERDLDARRFGAPWYSEIEVQGRPALVVTRLEGELGEVTVSWLHRPGVLVEVGVASGSEQEARDLAERVRPATTAELDDLRAAALEERLAAVEAGEVLLGRGRLSDGRGWGLVAHGGEGLTDAATLVVAGPPMTWSCAAAEGDPQVTAGPDAPVVGMTCAGTTGDVAVGFGRVRADVAEVALVDLDAEGGSTEVDRTAVLVVDGVAGFVVEEPEPDHRYRIVALDAAGERMGSARLGMG